MMAEITVYDMNHSPVEQREISEAVFGGEVRVGLIHQVVIGYLANKRQGTASALGRSDVNFTKKKPFRQKGTGRARQGSFASPLRKGGGVTFGPHPRDYRKKLPKKMRQEALRMTLADKFQSERLFVVKNIELPEPKTKQVVGMLDKFELAGKTLIVHDGKDANLLLSGRNISSVTLIPAQQLNALSILQNENLLVTEPALEEIERQWG